MTVGFYIFKSEVKSEYALQFQVIRNMNKPLLCLFKKSKPAQCSNVIFAVLISYVSHTEMTHFGFNYKIEKFL